MAISDTALKHELPEAVAQSLAAYVGCIAGAIRIDDYKSGLMAAGFANVEIVDTGADLNAYAKIENQSGCCSPAMDAAAPLRVMEQACCRPVSVASGLHQDLSALLSQYDINAAAATVRVYAMKPHPEEPKSCCGPTCCG